MQQYFGIKELYDVALKTTIPMKIGSRKFEKNEPILYFDKVQIAAINETTSQAVATGGKSNRNLIFWEDTKEVAFTLSEGVMSKLGLALLTNANVLEKDDEKDYIIVPKRENLVTSLEGKIELKYEPNLQESFFIYDNTEDLVKIEEYEIDKKNVTIKNAIGRDVIVEYYFNYNKPYTSYRIGEKLFNGFLKLEGKIYFKDDSTGINQTSLFEMPRLRLQTNLNISLGENASPVVSTFNIIGFPGEGINDKMICKMTLLSDDIDADI